MEEMRTISNNQILQGHRFLMSQKFEAQVAIGTKLNRLNLFFK